ncbi:sn-glycerol-1-phosphate dehydrogenase [Alkalihalobacillus sp. FSL R5-0424]
MKLLERVEEIMKEQEYEQETNPVIVANGALNTLVDYVEDQPIMTILLVVDEQTFTAAGKELEQKLRDKGLKPLVHCLLPNAHGDVIADEQTIVDVLIQVTPHVDCLVAVGSGTIHDVVRFVSAKIEKPFISCPTAPSVDGFNSKGAPVIVKGIKTTYQTTAPVALFADLSILAQAPIELIAAGFGDMIGKYTSLTDWQAGRMIADEPFNQEVYQLTKVALDACVKHAEAIGNREFEGIEALMNALLVSGTAMSIFGASHPASGAEHHLSHYWEMTYLEENKKQLLHGAKVARASLIITQFYKEIVRTSLLEEPTTEKNELVELINQLPEPAEMSKLLKVAGWHPEQAPIDEELIQLSLLKAYHLRDRWTLLRYYHETLHWVPDL